MHKHHILAFLLSCSVLLGSFSAHAAETAVVTEGKVNVRGKPSFVGEVITQLERGDKVTVLERINLEKPKEGEPTNWAKINLPDNTPVWVFALFIKEGKVSASRLNFRAGPGENYSVLGRVERGYEVKPIRTVAEWMEIEAPTNAYAFIDLDLVRFEGGTDGAPVAIPTTTIAANDPAPGPTNTAPVRVEPEESPSTPTSPPVVAVPDTNAVATAESASQQPVSAPEIVTPKPADETAASEAVANAAESTATRATADPQVTSTETPISPGVTPLPQPDSLPPVADPLPRRNNQEPIKRVVRREGIIRATKSIQAPTWYELVHASTGKTINYLYDSKLNVKLKDYRGQKVAVSGEEAIDPRWPNTPILDLETLDVLP